MSANTHIQLPFTTSHAFIVGINDYQHLTPLSTAVNDARVIAERLAEQHGFKVHAPLLNATHQSLRKLLTEDIPRLVGKDDRVLFYFAGHGVALDGEEGPNGYLVAADTRPGQEETLIPMATLHDALTTLPCRHGLLILDCCFSGAFKWSSGFRDVIFDLPKVIYEERFWRYCKDPAWQVITSSAHDQKAVDIITNQSLGLREEGGGQHSPFAASLLEALGGAGDVIPAGKGDGVMTATELYSYLRDAVETQTTENAKRQSPSIFNLKRHDKGEFIFLHPNHRFNLPPTPDRNPFMGLSSYSEEDASLFFGRDRVVEVLLEKVKANSLTVVSGASGTGKSSVIKAGVLPQLRKAGRTVLPIIRPGKEPMQTIATELPDIEKQLKNGAPLLVIDQYEELITQCLNQEERLAFEQQIAQWLEQYPELDIILSIRADFEPQFESEALAPWWAKGRYVVPSFSLDEIREVITRPAAQAVLFYEPEDLVEQLSEEVSQAPGALPLLSFTLSELYHAYLKSGRQDRSLAEEDYQKLGGVIGALRTRADAEYKALTPDEQSSMRKLMLRMVSLEGGELAGKRVYTEELQFSNAKESQRLTTIANRLVDARLLSKGTDPQGKPYIEPAHDALVRAWARLWEWIKTIGEEKITLQYKLSQAVNDYNNLLKTQPKKAKNLLWNSNPRLELLQAELNSKDHGFNAREETFVGASIKRRKARTRINWSIAFGVIIGLASLSLLANNQRIVAQENEQLAKDRAQEVLDSAKVAQTQRSRAQSATVLAISNNLASQSAMARLTDPTVAFRLAETALSLAPENNLAKGALLSAFYNTIIDHKTGLFYKRVSKADMPFILNKWATESLRSSDQLPEVPEDEYRMGFRNQTCYSPQKNYYFEARHEHNGDYYLELASFQSQSWSSRKFLEVETLFATPSFSPTEDYIIIPEQNRLDLCSPLDINEPIHQLFAPNAVRQAYFAERGKKIFAQTYDDRYYEWNLNAYNIPTIGENRSIAKMYYSPDGETLVLEDDGSELIGVWVFDQTWKKRGTGRAKMSPNNSSVTQEGYPAIQLSGYRSFSMQDALREFNQVYSQVDKDKHQFTTPEARRSITVTELQSQRRSVELLGHMRPILSIAISPDGESILTCSSEEVKLWDWNGNNYFSIPKGGRADFSPDGNFIYLFPWDSEEEFGAAYDGPVDLEIYTLSTKAISEWANAQGVYRLSKADRLRYGIGY
ncbi:MAG: caspase family protein [Lewinella sp.]|uniref:nSTAND1 domain-containing NTPase n=1 Tax=Lewinella sp. TaxID=2004506 RepID=UPI003D6B2AF9